MNNVKKPLIFMGTRVFIGLRPTIFGVEDEHVTLEYLGAFPEWKTLVAKCEAWDKRFGHGPVTVAVNGYANWSATNNEDSRYFDVALVGFKEYPELNYEKNWHITLGKDTKPVKPRSYSKELDAFKYDVCSTLWIGYKTKEGETAWISYQGPVGTMNPEELEPASWQS